MSRPEQVFHLKPEGEKMHGFAAGVRAGNTLYLSGELSIDDQFQVVGENDMAVQVKQVYEALAKVLEAHGLGFANVVKENMFVTDMEAFMDPAVGEVRKSYYADCAPPAATLVQIVRLAIPGTMIEIEAIAVFDD